MPPGSRSSTPARGAVTTTVTTSRPPGWSSLAFDPSGAVLGVGYQAARHSRPHSPPTPEPTSRSSSSSTCPAAARSARSAGRRVPTRAVAYAASGRWLAAVRRHRRQLTPSWLWDLATRARPDRGRSGRRLPLPSRHGRLGRGRPRQRRRSTVYDLEPDGTIRKDRQIARPDVPFAAMAVDPSGRSVAVASLPGRRVDVLDLTTGASRATLDMPSPGQPEFSRDGHSGGRRRRQPIRIYDTTNYAQQLVLAGSPDQPIGLAFSPDSSRLVSAVAGTAAHRGICRPRAHRRSGTSTPRAATSGCSPSAADQSNALVTVYKDGNGSRRTGRPGDRQHHQGDRRSPPGHGQRRRSSRATWPQAAGLDQNWLAHEFDLGTGRSIALGRCDDVVALDRLGRHGPGRRPESLCAPNHGPTSPPLPGPPSVEPRRRHGDRTHRPRPRHDAARGEAPSARPAHDGRPGFVVVQDAGDPKNGSTCATLRREPISGRSHRRTAASSRPRSRQTPSDWSLTTTIGDLIVLDLGKLAHAQPTRRRRDLDGQGAQRQRARPRRVERRPHRHGLVGGNRPGVVTRRPTPRRPPHPTR